ncbi:zinc ribbon domain-containing protein YjdM [Francisella sp. SYW-9]|uniref:zinc ribbon domain-containing protein YjdM n=1 Tax=Francisella sp. SYW-9 TaxID=2610888 RepID=UPI00123D9456|nr:zinc ribbon domain-containing protein YjdM [Francisella sp. SYW-9]
MQSLPQCPKCQSEYVYQDGELLICPECGYEWQLNEIDNDSLTVKDANGNLLEDGDTVTVIKDLKLKGSSQVIKVGTKVKNIRLVEGDHDIDCKVDGFGAMKLKSQFVKKV